MSRRVHLMVSLIAVMTASVSSQVSKPVAPLRPPATPTGSSMKTGQALINGTATDTNAAPLPNASVQLRNLATGQIEQAAIADQTGQFTLIARPEVPYVVEIADKAGHILAVGDVITVQAGDVAAAVVAVPARLTTIAGIFGDSINSVVSAAMNAGIAVVEPPPPLSPEK
jgi:carboxypeptidase family protein